MQENTPPTPNKRANMRFLPLPRSISRRAALALALLGLLPAGCAVPLPPLQSLAAAQPLVGRWRGAMAGGNAAVPSIWEMRADGTQSVTLTLPQGAMTAEGTWVAEGGVLTERTTIRTIALGGEQKTVVLAGPMETMFTYQLQGDTLTLTRSDGHQRVVLRREASVDAQ